MSRHRGRDDETVLEVSCPVCGEVLALARRALASREPPHLDMRCEWERVSPPDAPAERYTFWCAGRRKHREHRPKPAQYREARLVATLDEMERRGVRRGSLTEPAEC